MIIMDLLMIQMAMVLEMEGGQFPRMALSVGLGLMVDHWQPMVQMAERDLSLLSDLMENHLMMAVAPGLVLMEDHGEDQAPEDKLLVILQTGRDLSMVLDLMEGHLEGQIRRTPLELALAPMENPWEGMAQGDNSVVVVVILQTERDLSMVLDQMEDHSTDLVHKTPLDLALVLMEGPW